MTKEIKEILKKTDIDAVSYGVIINYIINLQKENENLLYEINGYLEEKERLKEKINKLEDYKSKNEKAAKNAKEKIKKYENYIRDLKNGNYPSPTVRLERQELIFKIREQEDLINILEGDDK